ncbi:MAG: hypothetical protein LDL31_06190 [Prosthecobacter sp.]|jgi:hypothetical protein|nr:hypothetical protein [Prosthecobacter sp.]
MKTAAAVLCICLPGLLLAGDWKSIPPDLTVPESRAGEPQPGARVRQTTAGWENSAVYHLLHLPVDWQPRGRYPLIIEYPGNGPYADARGDTCEGNVESCLLGYGISGGKGAIWAALPFIEVVEDRAQNAQRWWGDVRQTRDYCVKTVRHLCQTLGADSGRVFLAGFSRGSIACNFIGLHDDEIAALWRGFICHSHYDGSRAWPGTGGAADALERLRRLRDRPQWISQEGSTQVTEQLLRASGLDGRWTFVALPFPNHTAAWVLRDLPERRRLRAWFAEALQEK